MSVTETQKELLDKLKEMDSSSIPFFDAKKSLLEQGYSETEIVHALYQFSYDGKPNAPKKHNPVTTYYSQNPVEAERVAEYILKNAKASGYGRMAGYYLASRYAPGHHARAYYAMKFSDEIGFPFLTGVVLTMVSTMAVITYNLPREFVYSGFVVVLVYWIARKILDRF